MLRFLEVNREAKCYNCRKENQGFDSNINLDITADRWSTVKCSDRRRSRDISVRGNTKNMRFSMNKAGNMSMFGSFEVESGTCVS